MKEGKMELLIINGSPRIGGNTHTLLNEVIKGAEDVEIGCELIHLGKLEIKPCMADFTCRKPGSLGVCIHEDDMLGIYEKLETCKGIIFGTPVFFWNMTGQMAAFMHRTTAIFSRDPSVIRGKISGLVVVSGRRGNQNVANIFNMYFTASQMIQTDAVYGYATGKGEIVRDIHAMKSAFELGRCIGLLIREGVKLEFPDEYRHKFLPVYVSEKYGIPLSPGGDATLLGK
jgi:multimeric flavodoxin WrbA